MSRRLLTAALGLALSAGACGRPAPPETAAAATPEVLPDADALLARYIDAMGGAEVIGRYSRSVTRARLELPAQGISGPVEVWAEAPSEQVSRSSIAGVGVFLEGCAGGVPWALDPMGGARLKEGVERDQALRRAEFHQLLNLAAAFPTRETVGAVLTDGGTAYEVSMQPASGPPEIWVLDAASGLMVGSRSEQQSLMGTLPISISLRDYRDFGGILMPTVIEETSGPVRTRIVIESIEWDPPDFALPELPAEVRALMASSP